MTHTSHSISGLPTQQSLDHILNWFPADYDFDIFRDYMYGGSKGQKYYYWMYSDSPDIIEIGRGGVINQYVEARPVRGIDYEWAIEVFETLDQLLEIDFEFTDNKEQANFRLYGTTGHNLGGAGGFADGTQLLNVGYTDIIVNVGELGSDMKANDPKNTYLALHELGHALGLSHPGLPPNVETRSGMGYLGIKDIPLWDLYNSKDTIMSYNHAPSGPGQTYTEGDILALQAIWGREGEYIPRSNITSPPLNPESPDEIDANIILSKQGKGKLRALEGENIFYFDKFDPFKKKNADKIINFNPSAGDKIAFNSLAFPALRNKDSFTFATAETKKKLKSISRQDYDIVYYEKKGFIYSDGNESQKNWGKKEDGGIFAKVDRGLELTINDFIYYDI